MTNNLIVPVASCDLSHQEGLFTHPNLVLQACQQPVLHIKKYIKGWLIQYLAPSDSEHLRWEVSPRPPSPNQTPLWVRYRDPPLECCLLGSLWQWQLRWEVHPSPHHIPLWLQGCPTWELPRTWLPLGVGRWGGKFTLPPHTFVTTGMPYLRAASYMATSGSGQLKREVHPPPHIPLWLQGCPTWALPRIWLPLVVGRWGGKWRGPPSPCSPVWRAGPEALHPGGAPAHWCIHVLDLSNLKEVNSKIINSLFPNKCS